MSIASEITRINNNISSAYTACNNKGATMPVTQDSANLANTISSIPAGGGGAVEEKDVNFYDYDGTLLHSYSKTDFLALTEMPSNPTHTGLIAQGWNWDLADAKTYVTDYGELDIGQVYTTASGLSEFDIELTAATGLEITLNMSGTKNWGDGTSDTTTSHTYTNYGKYTITCTGGFSNTGSNGIFGQTGSTFNYYVKKIRLATNISSISNYSLQYCKSLNEVIFSNSTTTIENTVFKGCFALTKIIIPNSVTSMGYQIFSECFSLIKPIFGEGFPKISDSVFSKCYSLTKIIMPNSVEQITSAIFQYCSALTKIIIPKNLTTMGGQVFDGCSSVLIYDFSNVQSIIPMANLSVFTSINKLAKIIVPDSLYTDWIAASNWVNYADYIVKESDYSGS